MVYMKRIVVLGSTNTDMVITGKKIPVPGGRFDVQPNPALSAPAARASHDAIARACAAGLPVTVMRGGRIVRVSPDGTDFPYAHMRPAMW